MSALGKPSTVRLFTGVITFIAAVVAALVGFSALNTALNGREYGSNEVRHALVWLGAAGGALGVGVSLLIWEFTIRISDKTEQPPPPRPR